jgi:hypothetical protein
MGVAVKNLIIAMLFFSSMAKADSFLIKLSTDKETLRRADSVIAKFVLKNGNSYSSIFSRSDIASGKLERTIDVPVSNIEKCYFDWTHSYLEQDIRAAGPMPFNDFNKSCSIGSNVVVLSPSATIQTVSFKIESTAFARREMEVLLFSLQPEEQTGKVAFGRKFLNTDFTQAPIELDFSTLSFGPLKYIFEATWFKEGSSMKDAPVLFETDKIVID